MTAWPSGKAGDCKSSIAGSNPAAVFSSYEVTVFVTEMGGSDNVVVVAPAKAGATSALLIALREQFGERLRVVRQAID
jgi:hypothetical protein